MAFQLRLPLFLADSLDQRDPIVATGDLLALRFSNFFFPLLSWLLGNGNQLLYRLPIVNEKNPMAANLLKRKGEEI